jgi:hypothetical protein
MPSGSLPTLTESRRKVYSVALPSGPRKAVGSGMGDTDRSDKP